MCCNKGTSTNLRMIAGARSEIWATFEKTRVSHRKLNPSSKKLLIETSMDKIQLYLLRKVSLKIVGIKNNCILPFLLIRIPMQDKICWWLLYNAYALRNMLIGILTKGIQLGDMALIRKKYHPRSKLLTIFGISAHQYANASQKIARGLTKFLRHALKFLLGFWRMGCSR